jgi:DNA transposition AAA+ family ATPase
MKPNFVTTENVKKLMLGYSALKERGAAEACLMVVDGVPGLGKTHATAWLSTQSESIYVRARRGWTPATAMGDIAKALQGGEEREFKISRFFETNYSYVYKALEKRSIEAQREGLEFSVFIDEVDYFINDGKILESIRDLSDFLEIPIILIGMGKIRKSLVRFPQVASRISQMVEFQPLKQNDVTAVVNALCDFQVADDLLAHIAETTRGYMRELKEAIASIEKFGHRQGQATTITKEMMINQTLFFDRSKKSASIVRG